MPVTVYADVLVIVNLYVDFFLLWCTRRTLCLRGKPWRLAAGALTGALCTLVCLIPWQAWWLSLGWGAVSAVLTTAAAFWPLSRRGFLKAALCFWGFSLALAGLCLFLMQWAAPRSVAVVGHAVYLNLSLPLLFFCTAGAYGLFGSFSGCSAGRLWPQGSAGCPSGREEKPSLCGPRRIQAAPCGSHFPACR